MEPDWREWGRVLVCTYRYTVFYWGKGGRQLLVFVKGEWNLVCPQYLLFRIQTLLSNEEIYNFL